MSKLRPVWVSDRFETRFGLRSEPLECSHEAGEMKLRSTWVSFRFLRSVWVFRSTWNFHVSRNFFHFRAKWVFKTTVNGTVCFFSGKFLCNAHVQRKLAKLEPVWNVHVRGRQISSHSQISDRSETQTGLSFLMWGRSKALIKSLF